MSTRADYTDEEWNRLGRAPLVAALAISIADPGGPIEVLKESSAALRTIAEAAGDGRYGRFVSAVATDVGAKAKRRENPLGGCRARSFRPGLLRRVEALLVAKADETEADEFREWLRISAQRSAMAAREGGFLGIGGERVSKREQDMLGVLGEIFGTPST